jgi:hypothetical protein
LIYYFGDKQTNMKSYYAYYCNTKGKPLMIPLQLKAENKRAAYSIAYEFKQRELKERTIIKSIRIMEIGERA